MDEQAPPPQPSNPNPQPPPGGPPYYNYPPPPPYYPYAQQPYQPPQPQEPRLNKKGKIILGIVCVVLLFVGIFSTAHQPTPIGTPAAQQVLPASPEAIESAREQAAAQIAEQKAAAERAKRQGARGPTLASNSQQQQTGQQDPDAQFWHQIRQEDWKRRHEAPYVSGVGFVTKRPSSTAKEAMPSPDASRAASVATQLPPGYPGYPYPGYPGYPGYPAVPPGANGPVSPSMAHQPYSQAVTPTAEQPQQKKQEGQPDALPTGYDFDHAEGKLHRIPEGTIIETTLLNELNSDGTGPVICQVSVDQYDASGLHLLIPKGSKVLGIAHQVTNTNNRRMAVTFHTIRMHDGFGLNLDQFQGLDQIGEVGVVSKVNTHYLQIFGVSLAVGAISGLSEVGSVGATYSPWNGFRMGISQQGAESAMRILDRFLNRLPTVIVKPGTRVKIIITTDLPGVPEYSNHAMDPNF